MPYHISQPESYEVQHLMRFKIWHVFYTAAKNTMGEFLEYPGKLTILTHKAQGEGTSKFKY